MSSHDPRLLRKLKRECRHDPARFNRRVLGRPRYWWRQAEIAESVRDNPITLVPAGNAVGKDYVAAGIILDFLCHHANALVIATAPSQTQLQEVLWKEVERAYRNARVPLGGRMLRNPLKIDLGDGRQALAYSTTKTERLSGHHAPDLLAVLDEASGIAEPIYEAVDSLNPSRVLLIGNPLSPSGQFYHRCQSAHDNPHAKLIRVPSLESPDIHLARSPRGLADRTWLEKARHDYGESSIWWKAHVLAEFPDETHDALLPAWWVNRLGDPAIERAVEALRTQGKAGRRVLAADLSLGTGRDRAVFIVRDALGVLDTRESPFIGIGQAAQIIAEMARQWAIREDAIIYDKGGPGREFARYLEPYSIHAVGYHGGGSGGNQFANMRTRCAWRMRMRFDPERPMPSPAPPRDPKDPWRAPPAPEPTRIQPPFAIPARFLSTEGREELLGLRYHITGAKTALETKEDFAARLGRSPDYCDALLMTFALIGDGCT